MDRQGQQQAMDDRDFVARGAATRRGAAIAAIGLFCTAPFVVFNGTLEDAKTSDFRLELGYLVTGWGPWVLIMLGSLCLVPVAVSIGRSAFSRWALSPRVRRTYEAWGISLYLLGLLLALQTSVVSSAY